MNKKQIAITLGIVCFILTIAISIQFKTINNISSTVSQSLSNNKLKDEVLKWKEKYDSVYVELENSENELENVRQRATQNSSTSVAKEAEIKLNNILLGLNDVSGQGVEIILKDKTGNAQDGIGVLDNISSSIIHDADLRAIVNVLKNAGAEAISINGQRLILSTAITCEGTVIKINDQKIGSPFNIKAIGSPYLMYSSLTMPGGYISLLKEDGIIADVKKVDNVDIEKHTGVINFKYLKSLK